MDFLGIGVPEFFVILILALIVVGPRDLPKVAARLGKYVRDLRMMSEGFRAEWRRELGDAGFEDIAELRAELISARQALQEAGQEIHSVGQSVESEMKDAGDTVQTEVKGAHTEMSAATKDVNAELRETVSSVKTVGVASTPKAESPTSEGEDTAEANTASKTIEADANNNQTPKISTVGAASTASDKSKMVIPGRPSTPVVKSVPAPQSEEHTNGATTTVEEETNTPPIESSRVESPSDIGDEVGDRTIHPPQTEPVVELASSADAETKDTKDHDER